MTVPKFHRIDCYYCGPVEVPLEMSDPHAISMWRQEDHLRVVKRHDTSLSHTHAIRLAMDLDHSIPCPPVTTEDQ